MLHTLNMTEAISKLNLRRWEIPDRDKNRLKRDRGDLIEMTPENLEKECEKYKKLKRTFKIITWILVAVTAILLPVIVALIDKQKDKVDMIIPTSVKGRENNHRAAM